MGGCRGFFFMLVELNYKKGGGGEKKGGGRERKKREEEKKRGTGEGKRGDDSNYE